MDDERCILCGSKNEKGKQRLHSLPIAEPLRGRWISFIRLHFGDDWTPGEKSVTVCSLHFEACDFSTEDCGHILKCDSRPSIMLENQVPPHEESTPKRLERITILEDNENEPMDVEDVRIAKGTVIAFDYGQDDVELVHILVEKSTEVQINSLYSAKDVDDFIKSDKKKLLPKIIAKHESNILRLKKQQQPLSKRDCLLLDRLESELGVLQEKLFRWALEVIEENITISSTSNQQISFDKAEYLILKATESMHVSKLEKKDDEIKKLTFNLKVMTDAVKQMKQNDLVKRNKHLLTDEAGGNKSEQNLIAKLRLLVQEAHIKEKESFASLKQLRSIVAQNAKVRDAKETEQNKTRVDKDKTIEQLRKSLKGVDDTFQVMAARSDELVLKNNSLTKQLEELQKKGAAGGIKASVIKRKTRSNVGGKKPDCPPANQFEVEALTPSKVKRRKYFMSDIKLKKKMI